MTFSLSLSKWSAFALLPLLALACTDDAVGTLEGDQHMRGKQPLPPVEVGPAVHDTGTFELDRDAVDDAIEGDDWETLYEGMGSAFAYTGVISDNNPETNIFTSGRSKDDLDITQWRWKASDDVLDKNNITNAQAAAYSVDHDDDNDPNTPPVPHLVLYFSLDRYSNDGAAQVGFWFLKNAVGLAGNGTFTGQHANGDILVQSNFSQGGTVDTVTVYQWMNGALVPLTDGGDCASAALGDPVCGTVNQGNETSPWPYMPKPNIGVAGTFPQGTFFEGGIDLTALGLTDACFSTFLAETRSSTPFNSVLKDFVGPQNFDTCSLAVTKTCSNPRLSEDQTQIIYDITGKVSASGFGSNLFNVDLSDNPPADNDDQFEWVDCTDNTPLGFFPLATLSGDACYRSTMTVDLNQNGLSDTVTATANTAAGGQGLALTAQATATCPNLSVSPEIEVTKTCETKIAVENNRVVVNVEVEGTVCNVGDSELTNVTVEDLDEVTVPSPLIDGITLVAPADPNNPSETPGACATYQGLYRPTAAVDGSGVVTECPSEVVFKDTVEATATDIFGQPVTPHMAAAECKLCPPEGCPE